MARRRKDQNDEDSQKENQGNESDDSFGLPEIEYEPIRREEETSEPVAESAAVEEPVAETESSQESYSSYQSSSSEESTYRYTPPEEPSSIWPKVLGILLVIVLALGATWYFVIYQPKQKAAAEKARLALEQQENARKQKEAEENRLRLEREAAERRRLDSLAALSKTGTIETLTERTGLYYVVIVSALDSDLLMDRARKLSESGVSTKIIPPFGKHKVSRLTIADGESFAAAQTKADELKAEYGDGVWVLKY